MQPVPDVSEADVERIIRRDFDDSLRDEVGLLLAEYEGLSYAREVPRVSLAILKLADGEISRVREFLDAAKRDYRDVIAWAEYPELMSSPVNLPDASNEQIYDRDWQQYRAWLEKT